MNFRRRQPARARSRILNADLTPMIDVVFLLIIFFMTTAKFLSEARAELNLPQQAGQQLETPDEAGIVINLTSDGTLIINDVTIPFTLLDAAIADQIAERQARGEPTKLTIRADRDADTRHLNQLVTRLRELEVPAAKLATEVPG